MYGTISLLGTLRRSTQVLHLNDQEIGHVKYFAEKEVRLRHRDSVSDYQAGIDSLITQIDDWRGWELWEHWHDYINQLLDRARVQVEYYPVNNEEFLREEADREKFEKLREKSRSNQESHFQTSSEGKAYDNLADEALVMEQEESTPNEAVPSITKNEIAHTSLPETRLENETTDDALTLSDDQMRVEHPFQTQEQSTAVSSQNRPSWTSPQLLQQPAPGSVLKIASKEQAALTLLPLFQGLSAVLQ